MITTRRHQVLACVLLVSLCSGAALAQENFTEDEDPWFDGSWTRAAIDAVPWVDIGAGTVNWTIPFTEGTLSLSIDELNRDLLAGLIGAGTEATVTGGAGLMGGPGTAVLGGLAGFAIGGTSGVLINRAAREAQGKSLLTWRMSSRGDQGDGSSSGSSKSSGGSGGGGSGSSGGGGGSGRMDYKLDSSGRLTNGKYTVNRGDMQIHMDGRTAGKSQFLSKVDAEKAVLDAAEYADKHGLWDSSGKAKVPTNDFVGSLGKDGTLTKWINVYRRKSGMVHGCPGSAP